MKLFSRTIQKFWLAAIIILLAGFAMFMNFHETKAAITSMLNFAGKVTNTDGSEVTDGNYDFIFSLYNSSTGGTALWTETLDSSSLFTATINSFDSGTNTYTYSSGVATSTLRIGQHLTNAATGESVLITAFDTDANTITVVDGSPAWSAGQTISNLPYVEGGVIDVNLGAVTDLSGVDFNQPMYLEITFNGEVMQPRKLITAVAQAFNADTLDGYHATDFANLAGDSIVTGEWTFENILSVSTSSSETALSITQDGTGDIINLIGNSGQEVFTVTNIGNVGIGNSTPLATLDVNGDLRVASKETFDGNNSQTSDADFSAGTNTSTQVLAGDVVLGLDTVNVGAVVNTVYNAADGANSLFTADVDSDGDMDIISGSQIDFTVRWYENNGSESFTSHNVYVGTAGVYSVGAADFDGDSDIDIISASYQDDTIRWYENNGSESFTPHVVYAAADGAYTVYAADIDTDGDMDIVSGAQNDDTVRWHKNDGVGTFTTYSVYNLADVVTSVYAADVDGDTDMDILSASFFDGDIRWYENNGAETFTVHTIFGSAPYAYSVYAADVDSDGNMDVLSASSNDNTIRWYKNNGSETFTAYTVYSAASGAKSVYAADMDKDGDVDILSASVSDNTIRWYENNGSETFTVHSVYTVASGAQAVYASDIDSDGDNDILSASYDDDTIRWYETTGGGYLSSGTFTSSAIDSGQTSPDFTTLSLGISEETGVTDIQFRLRSADTAAGLTSATWYGPTGTSDYYTTSGEAINSIHDGDRYIQLQAYLSSTDSSKTPALHDFTINFEYNGGVFSVSNNGLVTSGSWNGSEITVAYGGTGLTSVSDGYFLVGTGGTALEATSSMYMANNGYIGLGTTTPSHQLSLTGNLQLPNTTYASQYGVVYKNGNRFIHDFSYGSNGSVALAGFNTFVGINSGNFTLGSTATLSTQASYNTGFGANSLSALTTGYYNTALGYNALYLNTSGYYNTGIGNGAMGANTTGYYNTAIGNLALGANTTGYANVAIGSMAGYYTIASASNLGSNNSVYIGNNTRSSANGNTNEIVIGYNANGLGSNTAVLGNSSIVTTALYGKVGIGTTTPLTRLYVSNGSLALRPAMTNADVLAVENSSSYSTAINLLSSFNTSSYIAFSNEYANTAASILYVPSAYMMFFSASGTTPLVVSGNGNVGVGSSTNPEVPLHVHKKHIGTTTRPTWSEYDVALFENDVSYDSIIQILAGSTRSSGIGFSDNNARNVGSIMYNHLSNSLNFTTNSSQRMTINSSGYVGIGTASPSAKLSVLGTAGLPILNIASSTGSSILYIDEQGEIGVGTNNPDTLLTIAATSTQMKLLYTGSAHAASFTVGSDGLFTIESNEPGDVYIDPTSKFGVGTSSPTSALSVYGDVFIEGTDRYVNFGTVAGSGGYGIRDNGGTLQIKNFGSDWTNVTLVGTGQVGWVPRYYENSPNLQATSSIYISNAGNVGIGDTNPASKLSLGGNIDMNNHDITEIGRLDIGSTYGYGLRFNSANGSMITWGNDSTHQFGGVTVSGIKINTGALDSGTGVTFGPYGAEPTASINSNGSLTLNGFAFIGGGRLTISEVSGRASSSILVQTSQGIPFLEFATSTGEIYMFVNKDGWLGLNTDTPDTFLHVGSANPDKVGSGENAYIEGSVEIDNILYVDGTATSSFAGNIDVNGGFSAGADNFYINGSGVISSGTWQGSAIGVGFGGTGLSSSPSYGQMLVGNASGAYTLTATSSLNIALSDTSGTLSVARGGTGLTSVDTGFFLIGDSAVTMQATSSIFIDATGKIGLGTTTPAVNLDIYSSTGPSMYLHGDNSGFKFTNDSGINYIESVGSNMTGAAELRFTDMNALNTWMVIGSTGNVSIGTSTPVHKFDVYGNATTYISQIRNIDTSASSAGLSIRVDGTGNILNLNAAGNDIVNITPTQSSFYNKVVMYGGDESVLPLLIKSTSTATTTPTDGLFSIVSNVNTTDNVVFKVDAGGNYSYDGSASSPAADYAEYFFSNDRDLKSGEAVCVDVSESNAVKRCERASDSNVMGIVSTQPAIIGNAKSTYANNKNYVIVGMLGQVPAKVSDENGSIRPGDSLTSASLPGYVMKANAGDSTVGVALESFGDQVATGTPAVVSTGEIKVLISRRNKSLTVEMVEDTVTEHIANMEIEDEVQILIANAVANLNLDNEIQPIVDEQINLFDQRLTVEFDSYDNRITTIAARVDGLAARMDLVEDNVNTLSQTQNNFDNQLATINEKLILLEANTLNVSAIKVDPNNGLAITDNNYYEAGTPTVSVVEIETATSTDKTAFVVNQLGNGDVVDFQADGVSIVNIADSGKVSVVGEMSIDGRLMVCSGAGCGSELDEAVDGTMGDMGVEGKVVAGAFESVCDEGFIWVPGSAKYGTMPGFCVMADEARIGSENIPTTALTVDGNPSSVWNNISQGEAQLACQTMGDNYHLINENEWLTIAENIIRVSDNDIDQNQTGLQLATGNSTNFTLSNGNKVYNLAGSLREWTDMIVTRAGLLAPTADDWQEYYNVTDFKGYNIAPPYYYDSSNGIGRIKIQDNQNALRGFVRGETSLYDLDLSYPPTLVAEDIGFRCAK